MCVQYTGALTTLEVPALTTVEGYFQLDVTTTPPAPSPAVLLQPPHAPSPHTHTRTCTARAPAHVAPPYVTELYVYMQIGHIM